jgi:hypothetical protein
LEILKTMPYVVNKYSAKIDKVLKLIEDGEILEKDAYWPMSRYERFKDADLVGLAQEGMTDFGIAEGAVKEFDKLKTTDPEKHKWMTEFMRIYREIGKWYNDYALEAGLITESTHEQIEAENLYYLMFKRAFSWSSKDSVEGRDVSLNPVQTNNDPIPMIVMPGIKGSMKKIKHPIAEMMAAVHNIIQMADHNYVLMSFAKAFTGWRGLPLLQR